MESDGRATVRRALDALKPYLAIYVAQALADAPRGHAPERQDMQALLGAMLEHWDGVFARRLPTTVRHYVFELKDVRNRWAHEEPFTDEEVRRAVDTARILAKAIGAPTGQLDGRTERSTTSPPPARAPRSARPLRQVDLMRDLYLRYAGNEERIIREYADAERRGEVRRKRNTHDLAPEQYARALLNDGLRKGWLNDRS